MEPRKSGAETEVATNRPEMERRSVTVIDEGDQAPGFSLQADDGTIVTLDSLAGKNVVLFFYPKDNTSG